MIIVVDMEYSSSVTFPPHAQVWWAKTPLGKKRAKAAKGDDDDGGGKKGKKGKGKKGKKKK